MISAGFAAVGGVILGFRIGVADPELVYWTHSGQLVFMTVLGGFANFFGPIVGALAFTLLHDQLQSITQYWRFVLGAILARHGDRLSRAASPGWSRTLAAARAADGEAA